MTPNADAFLEAILGKMTMTFARGQLTTAMPDTTVPVRGKPQKLSGFKSKKPYREIFCQGDTVVFATQRMGSDHEEATVFNFVAPDVVWIYMGTTNPKIPDLNSREYFQRSR